MKLTIRADIPHLIKRYVDAYFATHHDYRGHIGSMVELVAGVVASFSRKQKLNGISSTGI